MKQIRKNKLTVALVGAFGTGFFLAATEASAQQQAQRVEKIEVTGSNIKRTDTETPSVVQVITREQIERSGATSVAELLRQVPAVGAGAGTDYQGVASFQSGNATVSLRGLGSYASEYGLAWIGSHVVYDLRCEACDHLLRLPTSFYDRSSAGFLLSKITFDAQQISATASEAITVSIRNTLTIVFMLGYLLYINWQLTLIAFTVFPVVAFALRKIRRRMKKVTGMVQERTGSLTHRLEEAIGAHRVVKIFGGEAYESKRLREAANRLRLATAKQAAASAIGTPINQIIASVAVGVILYVALKQTTSGTYGAGDFIVYIFALLHLLTQLKTLSNVTSVTQRGMTAAESVFALIDEPPESDTGTRAIGRAQGRIRFEHVTQR